MQSKLKSSLTLIPTTALFFHPNGLTSLPSVRLSIWELKGKTCLVHIRDLWELEWTYCLDARCSRNVTIWARANNCIAAIELKPRLNSFSQIFRWLLSSFRLTTKGDLCAGEKGRKPSVWELETQILPLPCDRSNAALRVHTVHGRLFLHV